MSIDKMTSQRATTAYSDTLSRTASNSVAGAKTTQGPQGPDATSAATPNAASNVPAGAIIALSPGAQLFARALAAAQAAPEVRADRVAAIQAKLAQQPATVDADALATKLLG